MTDLCAETYRIPWGDHFRRPGQDGPGKSTWHRKLAHPKDTEECTGFPLSAKSEKNLVGVIRLRLDLSRLSHTYST